MTRLDFSWNHRPRVPRFLRLCLPCAAMLAVAGGCSTVASSLVTSAATASGTDMSAQMEAMNRTVALMALQGYVGAFASLNPGEFARYRIPPALYADSRGGVVEIANLGKDAQEAIWWKVKFTESGTSATSLLEMARSAAGDTTTLRRKLPNDPEVVVQKLGRNDAWLRGAKAVPAKAVAGDGVRIIDKGIENVTVPAGNFSAKHVVYESDRAATDLWTNDAIVGRSIKIKSAFASTDAHGPKETVIELDGFGTGAMSETGLSLRK
jgi:hypothetical protein